ncbi:MAG: hypothetical protein DMD38_05215 [Gemmatimonadetes bacterium]|nr:MAG: hypothetical protein AUI86_12105 [Gemmatimonadetes bacterium 13_1_40CM_3_66_12]OLD89538.1 MAG: hypothetical protein AUG85_01750 [Gemmatimonadetes bacterium 13_1_20CM_4_66_11]PYP97862.1 MAG: hypothetical protein DMD38_05215 [Gemmatimonadota bacterium]
MMLPDQIAAAVRHHWWLFLLRGIAAVVFGVLVLMWPGATVIALTAFIAAYALVDGIVAVGSAVRMRAIFDRWWILLIQGLISIAFGVLAFMNPALSLLYVVISVSLWMLLASLALFMLGRAHQAMGGSAVGSTIAAVASLVLAVLAVAYPGLTIAGVIALIAWFALVIGVVNLAVAFRVRALVQAAVA